DAGHCARHRGLLSSPSLVFDIGVLAGLECALLVVCFFVIRPAPRSTLFPYTTLFRSRVRPASPPVSASNSRIEPGRVPKQENSRSEEHTSDLQSREKLVCRRLREKKHRPGTAPPAPPSAPERRAAQARPLQRACAAHT